MPTPANKYFPLWPPRKPFPESRRDTTGQGSDFPSSAGDRERGRFRPSSEPRLTNVAVVNDDGTPIASEKAVEEETNLLLRAAVLGLSIITDTDLLSEAR